MDRMYQAGVRRRPNFNPNQIRPGEKREDTRTAETLKLPLSLCVFFSAIIQSPNRNNVFQHFFTTQGLDIELNLVGSSHAIFRLAKQQFACSLHLRLGTFIPTGVGNINLPRRA